MASNANGLLKHQHELQLVLETENIHVCLISETNHNHIKFRGYRVYHTVHPENTAKDGSAVIIKDKIFHLEEIKYVTEAIQATSVSIKTNNHRITVTAIY